jgi:hypothetical protein
MYTKIPSYAELERAGIPDDTSSGTKNPNFLTQTGVQHFPNLCSNLARLWSSSWVRKVELEH